MIDDKTAKMAMNTIIAYCYDRTDNGKLADTTDKCVMCAIKNHCLAIEMCACEPHVLKPFKEIGIFKCTAPKPPKFDVNQLKSKYFKDYLDKIIQSESAKAGFPSRFSGCYHIQEAGTIKIGVVNERENKFWVFGIARCHPNDAFNLETGFHLAIQRMAKRVKCFVLSDDNKLVMVYKKVKGPISADSLAVQMAKSIMDRRD